MKQDDWIGKMKNGDKESFRYFYQAYSENAIRTASAITKNTEMAKDAVQETFIRVFRQIGSYKPDLPFDPWFYRILTNECLRLLKKENTLTKAGEIDIENNSFFTEESFDTLSDLYDTIQSLDDLYRIPLILKYIKGFTEIEIADILELNHNTLKSRLFKGRKRLKEQLERAGKEGKR